MAKNALLKAEGWIITEMLGYPRGFPLKPGITLLFGQKPGKDGQYSVAWVDPGGSLQVLKATVTATAERVTLQANISHASQKWLLSGDCKREGTRFRISGSLKSLNGRPKTSKDGPLAGGGTWSAEGNPGGGGGIRAVAGVAAKKSKRRAPTSGQRSKPQLARPAPNSRAASRKNLVEVDRLHRSK